MGKPRADFAGETGAGQNGDADGAAISAATTSLSNAEVFCSMPLAAIDHGRAMAFACSMLLADRAHMLRGRRQNPRIADRQIVKICVAFNRGSQLTPGR